jgi:hypothetical protein
MRYALITAAAIILLALSAVAATQDQPAAPSQHRMSDMQTMQNCPMKVPGADVSVADVSDGIALTITTKSGDVADLRRRTENMAKMHSNGAMHGNMIEFSIQSEEVPNGTRVVLTPKDPAKLEELRNLVRQHVEQMKKHECLMMQGMTDHGAHHPEQR